MEHAPHTTLKLKEKKLNPFRVTIEAKTTKKKYSFIHVMVFLIVVLSASPSPSLNATETFSTHKLLIPEVVETEMAAASCVIDFVSLTATNRNGCSATPDGSICVTISYTGLPLNNQFDLSTDNGKTWTPGTLGLSTMCKTGLSAGTYNVVIRDRTGCTVSYPGNPLTLYYNICIPDANVKTLLLNNAAINTNGDSEIQRSEAIAFTGEIDAGDASISNLTGLEEFVNLTSFSCMGNPSLSQIDVSKNIDLQRILCSSCAIEELDLTNNPQLVILACNNNLLTTLDISNNTILERINFSNNQISSINFNNNPLINAINGASNLIEELDLSAHSALRSLTCSDNLLTYLNLKNGNNEIIETLSCTSNPDLKCVRVDNVSYAETNWPTFFDPDITFSLDCDIDWPIIDEITKTDLTCLNDNSGYISVIASGGTGTLSYSIDNGISWQSSNEFTNLGAGTYIIVIKDDIGILSVTEEVTLFNPPHRLISSVIVDHIYGCYGDETGAIWIDTPPLSPPAPDTPIIKSLGSSGVAISYSINDGNTWQSTGIFTPLPAGSYTLLVRYDDCVYPYEENPVIVNSPTMIEFENIEITPDNGLPSGAITVTATGGIDPYSYSCNGGSDFQFSETFSNLAADQYELVVMDERGCIIDSTITIPDSSLIISAVEHTDITECFGDETGTITITALRGSGALSYSIDNGYSWQLSNTFTNLPSGDYEIRVKDENDIESIWDSNPVTITEPNEITFTVSSSNPLCYGDATGEIRFRNVIGGDGIYFFSIDGGTSFNTDSTTSNISAGNYNLHVKDSKGCEIIYASNPRVISDPESFIFTRVDITNNTICDGSGNGTIYINQEIIVILKSTSSKYDTISAPLKASAPITLYSIDDGATWHENSGKFENLIGGTYNIMAKNNIGCISEWNENPAILYDINPVNIEHINVTNDEGASSGEISVYINSGVPPFEYRLDEGEWQISEQFKSLSSGTYLVQVRDANSCTKSETVTVEYSGTLVRDIVEITNTTFDTDEEICFNATDTIIVGDIEGNPVIFESDSRITLISGGSIIFLPGVHIQEGSYLNASITTDGTFCDELFPSIVEIDKGHKSISDGELNKPGNSSASLSMKIYPNPNKGNFTLEINHTTGNDEYIIYNYLGAVIQKGISTGEKTEIDLKNPEKGFYIVRIINQQKALYSKILVN
jgi:hypothetical protein